jgi:invasion protein IalB
MRQLTLRLAVTMLAAFTACAPAAAPSAPTKFGSWSVHRQLDRMTDVEQCSLRYAGSPRVFYSSERLMVIVFKGFGGVRSYRYRVDKAPAHDMVVTDSRRPLDVGFIQISDMDDEFASGKSALFAGLTLLGQPFEITIDLRGLREARDAMAQACRAPS